MAVDARCPEPKPMFLFSVAFTGIMGGAASGAWTAVRNGETNILLDYITGSDAGAWAAAGLAAGVAVAMSHRGFFRLLTASIFSILMGCLGYSIALLVHNADLDLVRSAVLNWSRIARYVMPLTLAMTIAHDLFLRFQRARKLHWFLSFPLGYALFGGMAGFAGWLLLSNDFFHAADLIVPGAFYGALQFLGMLAALAFDRRMRRNSEPSATNSGREAP